MKRNFKQPLKIVDNFFEVPKLWKNFAIKQNYEKDQSYYPGYKSQPLNEIDINLFHQLAEKIILHVQGRNSFERLKIQFAYTLITDNNDLPPHRDEPFYNVAGVIYLNDNPDPNAGTLFYGLDSSNNLKLSVEIKNVFNRMIIFDPAILHKQANVFGDNLMNSRLTITFFGNAI